MKQSEKSQSDILVCFQRKPFSEDAVENALTKQVVLQAVCLGFRDYFCSRLVFVVSEESRATVRSWAQGCEQLNKVTKNQISYLSERGFKDHVAEAEASVFYVIPDDTALPEILDQKPKYLLSHLGIEAWPAGVSPADVAPPAPAWTRHFNVESLDVQQQLARVRTVLKHRGEPGMPSDLLITGATGTGKSYFAKCLPAILSEKYDNPKTVFEPESTALSSERPFVSGNCASLSPQLADALLFGAVKGAYTGCDCDRVGLLESAQKGILFLDEVGELPVETQGKLLTALEERTFTRLGDTGLNTKLKHINCSIVFGTNVELTSAIREFKSSRGARGFREDLYYRINACTLRLPSFRERIAGELTGGQFVESLLEAAAAEFNLSFTESAKEKFRTWAHDYPWPGNHRDARHLFQKMKVRLLADEMGSVVSAYLMQTVLAEQAGVESSPDKPLIGAALREKVGVGRSPDEQKDLDRLFEICPTAPTRAAAGRLYYDRKNINHSDVLGKHLCTLGLAFDKTVEGHLKEAN